MSTPETIFAATWNFGTVACNTAWEHWQQHQDLAKAVELGTVAVEEDLSVNNPEPGAPLPPQG